MAEDQPSSSGGGPTVGPWVPGYPAPSASRPRVWPAMAVGGVGVLLAAAGLIVALTRPTPEPVAKAQTYTAAEIAAAHEKLCDRYTLQARTVRSDTSGSDESLARIAATDGAVMLYNAAANPALDAKYLDVARALASAYGNVSAMGSKGVASDAEWRAVLDDANAKDAVMRTVCGGR